MYCGDETGAVIGDIGSHTARFGYGGEDCPKLVITSAAYKHYNADHVRKSPKRQKVTKAKYSAPVSLLNLPPDDCFGEDSVGFVPIYSLNSNQQSSPNASNVDMGAYTSLWEYAFQSLSIAHHKKHTVGPHHEQSPTEGVIDHPILSSIDPHHGTKHHAEILEMLFESLHAPAAYLAPQATLSAFTFGRQSALVVDIEHSSTKVTPVVDGYTLRFGSVMSERGGEWLGRCQEKILGCAELWETAQCEEVTPRYVLRHKEDDNLQKLKLSKESPFHAMTVHQVMYEMMTGAHILPVEEEAGVVPDLFSSKDKEVDVMKEEEEENEEQIYSLPDGTKVNLSSKTGRELCRLPELFFSETLPNCIQTDSTTNNSNAVTSLPLHKLVHHSLSQILDADIRKELISNIIITGSASLFPGMDKRLGAELTNILPSMYKNRVICSKNSVENRYSTWIGGSILSSLGSFQQMWLSRREYEECGAILGLQKFH